MGARRSTRLIVAISICTLVVGGCATPGADGTANASDTDSCDPALGAVVGGILGALLGSNSGRAGQGAVLGGALGALACVGINAASRQTKTASQVKDEYGVANKGKVPSEPVVSAYQVTVGPNGAVTGGQTINVRSTVEVVPGNSRPVTEIREELAIYRPDGQLVQKKLKTVGDGNSNGGRFENQFSFSLPKGAPQGDYTIRTALFVNGQQQREGGGQDPVCNGHYVICACHEH